MKKLFFTLIFMSAFAFTVAESCAFLPRVPQQPPQNSTEKAPDDAILAEKPFTWEEHWHVPLFAFCALVIIAGFAVWSFSGPSTHTVRESFPEPRPQPTPFSTNPQFPSSREKRSARRPVAMRRTDQSVRSADVDQPDLGGPAEDLLSLLTRSSSHTTHEEEKVSAPEHPRSTTNDNQTESHHHDSDTSYDSTASDSGGSCGSDGGGGGD